MRHLVDLIPLPRALAELVLIVGLFLLAIVVSRLAGLLAAWLVSRRAVGPPGRRRGGLAPLGEAPLRARRDHPRPEPPGARDAPHPARPARPRDRALRERPRGRRAPRGAAREDRAGRAHALHPHAAG